jgi:hypothetical protein
VLNRRNLALWEGGVEHRSQGERASVWLACSSCFFKTPVTAQSRGEYHPVRLMTCSQRGSQRTGPLGSPSI